MKTLYFKEVIDASPSKVHNLMLSKKSYEEWTKPFSPTSTFQGDWSSGSKIFFVSTEEDQKDMGMIARVETNIPGEIVIIRHVGILSDKGELYEGEHVEPWKNSLEIYRFKAVGEQTALVCSLEVDSDEHEEMFAAMWPKALKILKDICERS